MLILLFPFWLVAQQPSHYVLGKQELEGVDIYGMLHARDGNYMLATSNGLIRFDGYSFQPIGCNDMLMSSVFNLAEDSAGAVYFNNLSGQVFKFSEGNCELFVALADSLVSADMTLAIDDHNRLAISSEHWLVFNADGTMAYQSNKRFFGPIGKMANGSLLSHSALDKDFVRWKDGKLEIEGHEALPEGMDRIVKLQFGDETLNYESNTCNVFRQDGTELLNPSELSGKRQIFKLYCTRNALWFASSSLGVLRVDRQLKPQHDGQLLFPRTLISDVMEDREGNVLMGTFGKGIYVIPKENTEDLKIGQEEDLISVAAMEDGSLYFGTQSGKLLRRNTDGRLEAFRDAKVKSMEALFAIGPNSLLIGELTGVLINTTTRKERNIELGSVKDMAVIDSNSMLIASNSGAFTMNLQTGERSRVAGLEIRHYSIGYDSITASMYSGTSKGLLISPRKGPVRSIKLSGKELIVRDFLAANGAVYAATSEYGILIFRHDSLVAEWNQSTGLASNITTQIEPYGDHLVIATAAGIQVMDRNGKVLRTIDQADGLNATKVLDMAVTDDELWVVHSAGVQRVMLKDADTSIFQPTLELKGVLVNDSIQAPLSQHDFSADQQKFSFQLSSISLRYGHGITYQYRLEGAETAWRTANYSDHVIEYRSLSAGTYTFRAKAVYRGRESAEVTYNFTIATPFYKAWWFYLLVLIAISSMLVLWFRRRLKRQQLLAQQQNELNASKLTAIQSQMNPHFIFNALNSIQSLVLKGDVDNSYSYITKFANLVRRTLNYSDKEFIDFSEEIKLIELYLTLEKLRFSEDFSYDIQTNGVEDVLIPPMLIQPFIENALVHGLLHRTGAKWIKLEFELSDELTCVITDNGVGRAKAKAIKERQRSEHESFSVNAIRTRFEILQRYHKGALGFEYQDLFVDGQATGTEVVLRIPVKRKF